MVTVPCVVIHQEQMSALATTFKSSFRTFEIVQKCFQAHKVSAVWNSFTSPTSVYDCVPRVNVSLYLSRTFICKTHWYLIYLNEINVRFHVRLTKTIYKTKLNQTTNKTFCINMQYISNHAVNTIPYISWVWQIRGNVACFEDRWGRITGV